ncbi:MAG: hypothetical protein ACLQIQ_07480 [Beijerinckiaceae bacterium]
MGRKKLWDSQVRLTLSTELLTRIDRVAEIVGLARLDLIRRAIEREIVRLEKKHGIPLAAIAERPPRPLTSAERHFGEKMESGGFGHPAKKKGK